MSGKLRGDNSIGGDFSRVGHAQCPELQGVQNHDSSSSGAHSAWQTGQSSATRHSNAPSELEMAFQKRLRQPKKKFPKDPPTDPSEKSVPKAPSPQLANGQSDSSTASANIQSNPQQHPQTQPPIQKHNSTSVTHPTPYSSSFEPPQGLSSASIQSNPQQHPQTQPQKQRHISTSISHPTPYSSSFEPPQDPSSASIQSNPQQHPQTQPPKQKHNSTSVTHPTPYSPSFEPPQGLSSASIQSNPLQCPQSQPPKQRHISTSISHPTPYSSSLEPPQGNFSNSRHTKSGYRKVVPRGMVSPLSFSQEFSDFTDSEDCRTPDVSVFNMSEGYRTPLESEDEADAASKHSYAASSSKGSFKSEIVKHFEKPVPVFLKCQSWCNQIPDSSPRQQVNDPGLSKELQNIESFESAMLDWFQTLNRTDDDDLRSETSVSSVGSYKSEYRLQSLVNSRFQNSEEIENVLSGLLNISDQYNQASDVESVVSESQRSEKSLNLEKKCLPRRGRATVIRRSSLPGDVSGSESETEPPPRRRGSSYKTVLSELQAVLRQRRPLPEPPDSVESGPGSSEHSAPNEVPPVLPKPQFSTIHEPRVARTARVTRKPLVNAGDFKMLLGELSTAWSKRLKRIRKAQMVSQRGMQSSLYANFQGFRIPEALIDEPSTKYANFEGKLEPAEVVKPEPERWIKTPDLELGSCSESESTSSKPMFCKSRGRVEDDEKRVLPSEIAKREQASRAPKASDPALSKQMTGQELLESVQQPGLKKAGFRMNKYIRNVAAGGALPEITEEVCNSSPRQHKRLSALNQESIPAPVPSRTTVPPNSNRELSPPQGQVHIHQRRSRRVRSPLNQGNPPPTPPPQTPPPNVTSQWTTTPSPPTYQPSRVSPAAAPKVWTPPSASQSQVWSAPSKSTPGSVPFQQTMPMSPSPPHSQIEPTPYSIPPPPPPLPAGTQVGSPTPSSGVNQLDQASAPRSSHQRIKTKQRPNVPTSLSYIPLEPVPQDPGKKDIIHGENIPSLSDPAVGKNIGYGISDFSIQLKSPVSEIPKDVSARKAPSSSSGIPMSETFSAINKAVPKSEPISSRPVRSRSATPVTMDPAIAEERKIILDRLNKIGERNIIAKEELPELPMDLMKASTIRIQPLVTENLTNLVQNVKEGSQERSIACGDPNSFKKSEVVMDFADLELASPKDPNGEISNEILAPAAFTEPPISDKQAPQQESLLFAGLGQAPPDVKSTNEIQIPCGSTEPTISEKPNQEFLISTNNSEDHIKLTGVSGAYTSCPHLISESKPEDPVRILENTLLQMDSHSADPQAEIIYAIDIENCGALSDKDLGKPVGSSSEDLLEASELDTVMENLRLNVETMDQLLPYVEAEEGKTVPSAPLTGNGSLETNVSGDVPTPQLMEHALFLEFLEDASPSGPLGISSEGSENVLEVPPQENQLDYLLSKDPEDSGYVEAVPLGGMEESIDEGDLHVVEVCFDDQVVEPSLNENSNVLEESNKKSYLLEGSIIDGGPHVMEVCLDDIESQIVEFSLNEETSAPEESNKKSVVLEESIDEMDSHVMEISLNENIRDFNQKDESCALEVTRDKNLEVFDVSLDKADLEIMEVCLGKIESEIVGESSNKADLDAVVCLEGNDLPPSFSVDVGGDSPECPLDEAHLQEEEELEDDMSFSFVLDTSIETDTLIPSEEELENLWVCSNALTVEPHPEEIESKTDRAVIENKKADTLNLTEEGLGDPRVCAEALAVEPHLDTMGELIIQEEKDRTLENTWPFGFQPVGTPKTAEPITEKAVIETKGLVQETETSVETVTDIEPVPMPETVPEWSTIQDTHSKALVSPPGDVSAITPEEAEAPLFENVSSLVLKSESLTDGVTIPIVATEHLQLEPFVSVLSPTGPETPVFENAPEAFYIPVQDLVPSFTEPGALVNVSQEEEILVAPSEGVHFDQQFENQELVFDQLKLTPKMGPGTTINESEEKEILRGPSEAEGVQFSPSFENQELFFNHLKQTIKDELLKSEDINKTFAFESLKSPGPNGSPGDHEYEDALCYSSDDSLTFEDTLTSPLLQRRFYKEVVRAEIGSRVETLQSWAKPEPLKSWPNQENLQLCSGDEVTAPAEPEGLEEDDSLTEAESACNEDEQQLIHTLPTIYEASEESLEGERRMLREIDNVDKLIGECVETLEMSPSELAQVQEQDPILGSTELPEFSPEKTYGRDVQIDSIISSLTDFKNGTVSTLLYGSNEPSGPFGELKRSEGLTALDQICVNQSPESQSLENLLPEKQSLEGLLQEKQSLENLLLENQSVKNQSPENILPDNQSLENLFLENQSLENLLPENQSLEGMLPEKQSLENLLSENQSLGDLLPEKQSLEILLQEDESLGDLLPEKQSLENLLQEDQSLGDLLPEKQSLENLLQEDQSLENLLPEYQSLENLLPEKQLLENLLPEKQSLENLLLEKHSVENRSLENQSPDASPSEKVSDHISPEFSSDDDLLAAIPYNVSVEKVEPFGEEILPAISRKTLFDQMGVGKVSEDERSEETEDEVSPAQTRSDKTSEDEEEIVEAEVWPQESVSSESYLAKLSAPQQPLADKFENLLEFLESDAAKEMQEFERIESVCERISKDHRKDSVVSDFSVGNLEKSEDFEMLIRSLDSELEDADTENLLTDPDKDLVPGVVLVLAEEDQLCLEVPEGSKMDSVDLVNEEDAFGDSSSKECYGDLVNQRDALGAPSLHEGLGDVNEQEALRAPSSHEVFGDVNEQDVLRAPSSHEGFGDVNEQDVLRAPSSHEVFGDVNEQDVLRAPSSHEGFGDVNEQDVLSAPSSHEGFGDVNEQDVLRAPSSHEGFGDVNEQDVLRAPSSHEGFGDVNEQDVLRAPSSHEGFGDVNEQEALRAPSSHEVFGDVNEQEALRAPSSHEGFGDVNEQEALGAMSSNDFVEQINKKDSLGAPSPKEGFGSLVNDQDTLIAPSSTDDFYDAHSDVESSDYHLSRNPEDPASVTTEDGIKFKDPTAKSSKPVDVVQETGGPLTDDEFEDTLTSLDEDYFNYMREREAEMYETMISKSPVMSRKSIGDQNLDDPVQEKPDSARELALGLSLETSETKFSKDRIMSQKIFSGQNLEESVQEKPDSARELALGFSLETSETKFSKDRIMSQKIFSGQNLEESVQENMDSAGEPVPGLSLESVEQEKMLVEALPSPRDFSTDTQEKPMLITDEIEEEYFIVKGTERTVEEAFEYRLSLKSSEFKKDPEVSPNAVMMDKPQSGDLKPLAKKSASMSSDAFADVETDKVCESVGNRRNQDEKSKDQKDARPTDEELLKNGQTQTEPLPVSSSQVSAPDTRADETSASISVPIPSLTIETRTLKNNQTQTEPISVSTSQVLAPDTRADERYQEGKPIHLDDSTSASLSISIPSLTREAGTDHLKPADFQTENELRLTTPEPRSTSPSSSPSTERRSSSESAGLTLTSLPLSGATKNSSGKKKRKKKKKKGKDDDKPVSSSADVTETLPGPPAELVESRGTGSNIGAKVLVEFAEKGSESKNIDLRQIGTSQEFSIRVDKEPELSKTACGSDKSLEIVGSNLSVSDSSIIAMIGEKYTEIEVQRQTPSIPEDSKMVPPTEGTVAQSSELVEIPVALDFISRETGDRTLIRAGAIEGEFSKVISESTSNLESLETSSLKEVCDTDSKKLSYCVESGAGHLVNRETEFKESSEVIKSSAEHLTNGAADSLPSLEDGVEFRNATNLAESSMLNEDSPVTPLMESKISTPVLVAPLDPPPLSQLVSQENSFASPTTNQMSPVAQSLSLSSKLPAPIAPRLPTSPLRSQTTAAPPSSSSPPRSSLSRYNRSPPGAPRSILLLETSTAPTSVADISNAPVVDESRAALSRHYQKKAEFLSRPPERGYDPFLYRGSSLSTLSDPRAFRQPPPIPRSLRDIEPPQVPTRQSLRGDTQSDLVKSGNGTQAPLCDPEDVKIVENPSNPNQNGLGNSAVSKSPHGLVRTNSPSKRFRDLKHFSRISNMTYNEVIELEEEENRRKYDFGTSRRLREMRYFRQISRGDSEDSMMSRKSESSDSGFLSGYRDLRNSRTMTTSSTSLQSPAGAAHRPKGLSDSAFSIDNPVGFEPIMSYVTYNHHSCDSAAAETQRYPSSVSGRANTLQPSDRHRQDINGYGRIQKAHDMTRSTQSLDYHAGRSKFVQPIVGLSDQDVTGRGLQDSGLCASNFSVGGQESDDNHSMMSSVSFVIPEGLPLENVVMDDDSESIYEDVAMFPNPETTSMRSDVGPPPPPPPPHHPEAMIARPLGGSSPPVPPFPVFLNLEHAHLNQGDATNYSYQTSEYQASSSTTSTLDRGTGSISSSTLGRETSGHVSAFTPLQTGPPAMGQQHSMSSHSFNTSESKTEMFRGEESKTEQSAHTSSTSYSSTSYSSHQQQQVSQLPLGQPSQPAAAPLMMIDNQGPASPPGPFPMPPDYETSSERGHTYTKIDRGAPVEGEQGGAASATQLTIVTQEVPVSLSEFESRSVSEALSEEQSSVTSEFLERGSPIPNGGLEEGPSASVRTTTTTTTTTAAAATETSGATFDSSAVTTSSSSSSTSALTSFQSLNSPPSPAPPFSNVFPLLRKDSGEYDSLVEYDSKSEESHDYSNIVGFQPIEIQNEIQNSSFESQSRQMSGTSSAVTSTQVQQQQMNSQNYVQSVYPQSQSSNYHEMSTHAPQNASTATRELDELMASLSEFRMTNRDPSSTSTQHAGSAGDDPAYARPHKARSPVGAATPAPAVNIGGGGAAAYGDQLDSMLGSLQSDMNRQGVSTKTKGLCAACNKPVVSQMITALGKVWHVEHFTCAHCKMTLGTMSFYEREGKAYCEQDYHNLFAPRCAYCSGPITDKCVTALDKTWHPEHFFCGFCGCNFGDQGFHERDGQAYCKEDFLKMFAPKCGGCGQPINDSYISALNRHWHPQCFVCWDCQRQFGNMSFFDHDGLPYCEQHYHAKRGSLCADCQQPITGPSIIAMGRKFHPKHFTCAFCLKQLNNVTFKEQNSKPYCHPCFSKLFAGTKMMD